MTMVEKVARSFVPVLGYSTDCDWERVWVGNNVDSPEAGSLAYLCRSLATAAINAALEEGETPLSDSPAASQAGTATD